MWNIAKSAEAMFSRWALKRICKFLLKKKLGQFILGDIDLDQLDVQLTEGTIQLTDLALNADFLNSKLSASASLYIKEGSIGSLLVRMPWKDKGCYVELDEFEVVLAPCAENCSFSSDETTNYSEAFNQSMCQAQKKYVKEVSDNATAGNLHEGVKIIANMVKWLLTSFNVKIKKMIVAFDPNSHMNVLKHETLVLRVAEIECGSRTSEDGILGYAEGIDGLLETSRLTNYITFQGAIIELIQMDDVIAQSSTNLPAKSSFESSLDIFPASVSTIMTGERGGVSGNLKLSIPWKNGSLDIRKVHAEASLDPIELRFQPSTIKWILCSWEPLKSPDNDEKTDMSMNPRENVACSSVVHSSLPRLVDRKDFRDNVVPVSGGSSSEFSSLMGQEPNDVKLPFFISNWMPSSVEKDEPDFGASVDQFFECFDGMRSSQSALGASGMWNWTCSVFSAITAASSLASGSLHVSSEQQHVQTNLKATVAGISLILSFHDEDELHSSDLRCNQEKVDSYLHFLVLECYNIHLQLQVCPQDIKFEGTIRSIELGHCLSHRENGLVFFHQNANHMFSSKSTMINQLQLEVQNALPKHAACFTVHEEVPTSAVSSQKGPIGNRDGIIKIVMLKTSGSLYSQFTMKSGLQNDKSDGAISFSVELPAFIFWVNFSLIVKVFTFIEEICGCIESSDGGMKSLCKINQSSHEKVKSRRDCLQKGGSETHFMTSFSGERLRGTISIFQARILLCFPFHAKDDVMSYFSCNEFIALDLCSPLNKSNHRSIGTFPVVNHEKRFSIDMTRSLCVNVGNLEIFIVNLASEDCHLNSLSDMLMRKFVAEHVISTSCHSSIHTVWPDGPVTGQWIAERAKSLAWSPEFKNSNRFMDKGHEFASATIATNSEESSSLIHQEILLSSGVFLHVHLAPAVVKFGKSQYTSIHNLLDQMMKGLSSDPKVSSLEKQESSVHQITVLVECDSLEVVIKPEKLADAKSPMLSELPGSWCRLKLSIKKFELLCVSNIGGLDGASFFWLSHGEGKLRGSLSTLTNEDFVLISCTNSTMKRGDGEGSNALSSELAGSDIFYMWEPRNSHGYTTIKVKCATIVANGGRLDWFDSIASFFSLPYAETENNIKAEPDGQAISGFSFALNLIDVGLSYEPYLKNLLVQGSASGDYVACLLAASSFGLSSTTIAGNSADGYNIRVQDLGLLLCSASEFELLGGTYNVQYLHKVGYVKVAHEALIEAILQINSHSEMLWQLECSDSQIDVETCGDTTLGMIKLATQLQQLLAPNLEESLAYLQTRWDNLQKREDFDSSYDELWVTHSYDASLGNEPVKIRLMDEGCEDAFLLGEDEVLHSQSQLQESLLFNTCQYYRRGPAEIVSPDLPFSGAVHLVGSEDCQASELQTDHIPKFIESYCLADLRSLSELTAQNQLSGETIKGSDLVNAGITGERSGWYQDTSLMIVEDHISEASDLSSSRQSVQGDSLNPSTLNSDGSAVIGRVVFGNINVRWRMYAGSDWVNTGKNNQVPRKVSGRDTNFFLELVLYGLDCQYDMFPVGGSCVSRLCLSFNDIHLYDNSVDAPLKLVLGHYHSKRHPRESSSKAFIMDLEAIRPDSTIPIEEYRLCISLLPLRLNLHQRQLEFFVNFFGGEDVSCDNSLDRSPGGSASFRTNGQDYQFVEEALLPFFQKFDVKPLLLRVDYIPERVNLGALKSGKYVELVNLVPWKGVELQLKHVHAVDVFGWGNVCETIIGEWLEDVSQNQIHKVLRGIPTLRSLISVGKAAAKLVSCPVENYRKDNKVLKGVQRGTLAFLKSISREVVGLGLHLAAGADDILLQAECVLASSPTSSPWPGRSEKKPNVRSNQPRDAQQGIKKACESLRDGMGKSASVLVQSPIKKYHQGAGAGAAITTAVKAVPAATIASVSACASAVHYTLLGLRNSLDPEHKKESMEKYLGPNPPEE
ncbi:hypothetical protein SAY86_018980 [Trapa natans]|uniref:Autophagy-related protein 2 n=1 Tax=Trapa natans TaxID=22666 RepID=A0AAN7LS05_TRANT|nr:hypothetical protein SAY86_018980 [Trapa natans]